MAELGTSGSVDGYNQLLIKGRFQQKNIEGVLKRYIRKYCPLLFCFVFITIINTIYTWVKLLSFPLVFHNNLEDK